jgi:hypothetical protein
MSDPIAQAAQQIQHEDKPQGIAVEIMGAMHALEEKVEHFLHPDAPAVARPGESAGTISQPVADTTSKSSAPLVTTAQPTLPTSSLTPQPSSGASAGGDVPNAAGGASSAAQSTDDSAQGAAVGGAGEQGNVCASAAGAYTAVEAAARCAHVHAGEPQSEGWDG